MLASFELGAGEDPNAHDMQVAENSSAQMGVALLLTSQSIFYLTR